jgi:alpha-tubulin suppressor-like RCC1 family protein
MLASVAAVVLAGVGTGAGAAVAALAAPAGQVRSTAAVGLAPMATTVLGWGQDSYGQLGDGSSPAQSPPVFASLPSGTEVAGIAAGYDHSLIVTTAGEVLAAGRNDAGQLGNGTTTDSDTPVPVSLPGSAKVTAAAAGDAFSLALTSAGGVLAWGDNEEGELGDGGSSTTPISVPVPVQLPGGTTATQVAAGSSGWGLALTSAGQVYAWGDNLFGQLGNGTTTESAAPVQVQLPGGTTVTQIAAGANTGYALTSTGAVYAWGFGGAGALGDGSAANSDVPVQAQLPSGATITQLAAGGPFALARTSAGQVLAWGGGGAGQLGDGSTANSDVPVQVQLPSGVTVAQVAAGGGFGLAATSTGSVFAWGDNVWSELDDGSAANSAVPVQVQLPPGARIETLAAGQYHVLALPVTPPQVTGIAPADGLPAGGGTITLTGSGLTGTTAIRFGQVSAKSVKVISDSEVTATIPPGTGRVDLTVTAALSSVSATSPADQYTYLAKGTPLEWGYNWAGQLGNGQFSTALVPVAAHLPAGVVVTALARAYATTYALTSTGAVYAWGYGNYGDLGDGGNANSATPVQVLFPAGTVIKAIAAGEYGGYALASTGAVYAWGYGGQGELGNGQTTNAYVPVQVSLPQGVTVTAIAGEQYDGLALTSTGAVYAWGFGNDNELGNGQTAGSDVPVTVQLPSGAKVTSIAAAADSALALTSAGTVLGWGYNAYGNLGNGTTTTTETVTPVSLPSGTKAKAIAAAFYDGYALTSSGKVLAWGYNADGELGNGTTSASNLPVPVTLPAGATVSALSGEDYAATALTTAGKLLAWGYGQDGALGDGVAAGSDVPVTVQLPAGIKVTQLAQSDDDGDAVVVSPVTVVTKVTPARGAAGAKVTITGLNLAGATKVKFGGKAASFTVISSTKITATAPAGTGVVDITVVTPLGTSAKTSSDKFTYRG